MRNALLASAAILALAMAAPAFAQTATGARPGNEIGTGNSLPMSNQASNIGHSDTKSSIAPRLPSQGLDGEQQPVALLGAAQRALKAGKTGAAQEALERAETRLLDRSTTAAAAATPDQGMVIDHIESARKALGQGDKSGADQHIAAAITALGTQGSMGQQGMMSKPGMMGNGMNGQMMNGQMQNGQMMNGQMQNGQMMNGQTMSAPPLRNKVGPAVDVGGGATRALNGGPLAPQTN